jgi:hypothetical protein
MSKNDARVTYKNEGSRTGQRHAGCYRELLRMASPRKVPTKHSPIKDIDAVFRTAIQARESERTQAGKKKRPTAR